MWENPDELVLYLLQLVKIDVNKNEGVAVLCEYLADLLPHVISGPVDYYPLLAVVNDFLTRRRKQPLSLEHPDSFLNCGPYRSKVCSAHNLDECYCTKDDQRLCEPIGDLSLICSRPILNLESHGHQRRQ